jgi:hypothetical protein
MSNRTSRFASLAGLLLLAASSPLAAQKVCPTPESNLAYEMEYAAKPFQGPSYSSMRARLNIPTLGPSTPKESVTDDNVCKSLYKETLKSIDRVFNLPTQQDRIAFLESKRLLYFHIGPYYAVMVRDGDTDGMTVNGMSDLLIFTEAKLTFIGATNI